jgi:hypothetical protein
MTTVVILQSNYIPWRGYFDLIRRADHFVFYDDVQFTKNDWRNRNRIVAPNGAQWLSIPIKTSGKQFQSIADAQVADMRWAAKHQRALQAAFARGPEFKALKVRMTEWFDAASVETSLTEINRIFIVGIMEFVGLNCQLHDARSLDVNGNQTGRLVNICKKLNATRYLSGPAAKSYLDEKLFTDAGIEVEWMKYPDYVNYTQSDGGYEPGVSILDCLAWLPANRVLDENTA